LAACILACAGAARAQQAGDLGAGVVVGRPIGATAKYWLDGTKALDLGVGFSDDPVAYGDFLWHGWDLFPQPARGKLGGYVGLGPRIQAAPDTQFALRTIAGVDYWVDKQPIELFVEAGPVFRMTPTGDVDADVGLGVRFYFGAKSAK
jgi:hypothetical protein